MDEETAFQHIMDLVFNKKAAGGKKRKAYLLPVTGILKLLLCYYNVNNNVSLAYFVANGKHFYVYIVLCPPVPGSYVSRNLCSLDYYGT